MLLWVSFRSCWRPCWPWYHHGLPVCIPGVGQKYRESHGCVFPHLGLSHSTVFLITSTCACAHKHKLNLNSLTKCLARMEHDFCYLASNCHQPHASLFQARDGEAHGALPACFSAAHKRQQTLFRRVHWCSMLINGKWFLFMSVTTNWFYLQ